MAATDPFSLVFSGLWELVWENPKTQALVKERNLIRFDDEQDRDPIKEIVEDADLPELALIVDGTPKANMHNTSCTSMIVKRYAWLINTGDFRANYRLHPVEFALFSALARWKEVVAALTWNSYHFVKRCDLLEVSHGQSDQPKRNRGIAGWSALWRCEVEMHFRTQDLINYTQEATP